MSSTGTIPNHSIYQNFRRVVSSGSSPFIRKTLASEDCFGSVLPQTIQPRRVSTATDPLVAILMRPVTNS
ncbi:hypothetical protein T10_3361 [Trichinella papuae]|uniref:Uncharacterized protein n=1 Tax=Trichinella papuae TaxID=268474 RepID=A0A0V1N9M4_9BILA|nr:hypothetical protein T10_3361 [Trichinella papuae]